MRPRALISFLILALLALVLFQTSLAQQDADIFEERQNALLEERISALEREMAETQAELHATKTREQLLEEAEEDEESPVLDTSDELVLVDEQVTEQQQQQQQQQVQQQQAAATSDKLVLPERRRQQRHRRRRNSNSSVANLHLRVLKLKRMLWVLQQQLKKCAVRVAGGGSKQQPKTKHTKAATAVVSHQAKRIRALKKQVAKLLKVLQQCALSGKKQVGETLVKRLVVLVKKLTARVRKCHVHSLRIRKALMSSSGGAAGAGAASPAGRLRRRGHAHHKKRSAASPARKRHAGVRKNKNNRKTAGGKKMFRKIRAYVSKVTRRLAARVAHLKKVLQKLKKSQAHQQGNRKLVALVRVLQQKIQRLEQILARVSRPAALKKIQKRIVRDVIRVLAKKRGKIAAWRSRSKGAAGGKSKKHSHRVGGKKQKKTVSLSLRRVKSIARRIIQKLKSMKNDRSPRALAFKARLMRLLRRIHHRITNLCGRSRVAVRRLKHQASRSCARAADGIVQRHPQRSHAIRRCKAIKRQLRKLMKRATSRSCKRFGGRRRRRQHKGRRGGMKKRSNNRRRQLWDRIRRLAAQRGGFYRQQQQ